VYVITAPADAAQTLNLHSHTGPHTGLTGDKPDLTIKKPKPLVTDGGQSAGVPFTLRCVGPEQIPNKTGTRSKPENYRPVSLTSQVCKVFEALLRDKLVDHLEANNLLNITQHGFRRGRSCLTFVCLLLNGTSALFRPLVPRIVEIEHTNHVKNNLK